MRVAPERPLQICLDLLRNLPIAIYAIGATMYPLFDPLLRKGFMAIEAVYLISQKTDPSLPFLSAIFNV